jgi:hypothetical protein
MTLLSEFLTRTAYAIVGGVAVGLDAFGTETKNMKNEAMLGGERVGNEAYQHYQREIDKLIGERDKLAGKVEMYRGLCFCLLGLILLAGFLNSCTTAHH